MMCELDAQNLDLEGQPYSQDHRQRCDFSVGNPQLMSSRSCLQIQIQPRGFFRLSGMWNLLHSQQTKWTGANTQQLAHHIHILWVTVPCVRYLAPTTSSVPRPPQMPGLYDARGSPMPVHGISHISACSSLLMGLHFCWESTVCCELTTVLLKLESGHYPAL
jgi:hypothetical protein